MSPAYWHPIFKINWMSGHRQVRDQGYWKYLRTFIDDYGFIACASSQKYCVFRTSKRKPTQFEKSSGPKSSRAMRRKLIIPKKQALPENAEDFRRLHISILIKNFCKNLYRRSAQLIIFKILFMIIK